MSSGYDFSVSTYAPDGQIFQVEYAKKAIENAPMSIAIKCKDGLVMGHMHLIQNQLVKYTTSSKVYGKNGVQQGSSIVSTISQIKPITNHAIMGWSGIFADGIAMLSDAKDIAHSFEDSYGTEIHGSALCDRLVWQSHQYITYSHLRPYGCSSLIATKSYLGLLEPDANCFGYRAIACGKGNNFAITELEKLPSINMTCDISVDDAIKKICQMYCLLM